MARSSFDRFLGILQHLAVAKELILSKDAEKARMAVILLDSLADGLMFSLAINAFEDDQVFANFIPPQYPESCRGKVIKYFDEKVDFCVNELKLLSKANAHIFKVLHFYRNAAYHRDIHNPQVISPIACIMFRTTLRLFQRSAAQVASVSAESIGVPQAVAVAHYCTISSFINYSNASREAAQKLGKGVVLRLSMVRSAFTHDIECRLAQLNQMNLITVYSKSRKELDEILKRVAFEMKGIDDNLSAEVRQLHYRIVGKAEGGEPSKKEYMDAEQRYKMRIAQAFNSFKPEATWGTIGAITNGVKRLKIATSLENVLSEYFDIDKQLVEVEVLARYAERRIEQASQFQLDLERGK